MSDILETFRISAAGMQAQGTRLRVIGENIANADTRANGPGGVPYRRKIVTFRNELDRATGVDTVRVDKVQTDSAPFQKRYEPGHPGADAEGYVLAPNVTTLIEMTDMREAQRSYEANLNMIRTTKTMVENTIELLR